MKKTLIILVLLLVAFSNSSFADKLPSSLFGIELFDNKNSNIFPGYQDPSSSFIRRNFKYKTYKIKNDDVPKINSLFEIYQITSYDKNFGSTIPIFKHDDIIRIRGLKNYQKPNYDKMPSEYRCTKEKELLVKNLSVFYSLENGFNNIFFKTIKTNENKDDFNFWFIDENNIKYKKSYSGRGDKEVVLTVSCHYSNETSWVVIGLQTEYFYDSINDNREEVEFIDFNYLKTDLTGL